MAAVKKAKGIAEEGKKAVKTLNVRELKEKVKELRAKKVEALEAGEPRPKIDRLRRRLNRLKNRTRQAA